MLLPPTVKVKFSNLGDNGPQFFWPKSRLSLNQIEALQRNYLGFVMIHNGTDVSTQTTLSGDFPKPVTHRICAKQQKEIDERNSFYETVTRLSTVDVKKPTGNSQARLIQMFKNIVTQFESIKIQLGPFSRFTMFGNVHKMVADILGVAQSTVFRYIQKTTENSRAERTATRKMRNEKALNLLSIEERQLISEHIDKCYVDDSNFSVHSLHADLQNLYDYPHSFSTLYRQLKAMRYSYKIKTYNPFCTVREDIVGMRKRYLQSIEQLRAQNAFICYYDETWVYHGMTKTRGWNRTDTSPYLIANLGDLKNPRPGFAAASDKGQRAIVLAVTTESEILPGSVDVVIPNRPTSEILVDYHQYMSSDMYMEYMKRVLPKIVAATPTGRQAVLVIDNATIHNALVEKLPTKSSTKPQLLEFLDKHNIATSVTATQKQLWEECEAFMDARGGRAMLKRYYMDEYAAALGVKILRLPPYHCQFSPIELIWNQLKSHLRTTGKTADKLETVASRAKEWLSNTKEEQIAFTYEHVLQIEEGIKLVMDEDDENWEWDDDLSADI